MYGVNKKELIYIIKLYEKKLEELMAKDEYEKFTIEVANSLILKEVNGMENSEFKQFCLQHFDEITK